MMNSSNISSNIARQILIEAKKKGVSVEDYLNEIAEDPKKNGNNNLPKVHKTKTKVDFSKEREWLEENADKYLGKWVVLDGKRLVGSGEDPIVFVEKARKQGVKIPYMKFITDESEPFMGGWL